MDFSNKIEWKKDRIWGSAFKPIEAPMSFLNEMQNKYGSFWSFLITNPTSFSTHSNKLLEGIKHCNLKLIKISLIDLKTDVKESFIHLYKKKQIVPIVLATGIAFPATIALIPVSMIADIFAGVIQAGLRLCQGADKNEVLSILHKKVVASPIQQGIYFLTSVITLGIISGVLIPNVHQKGFAFGRAFAINTFFWSALTGNLLYCTSQKVTASLPRCLRPDGYNVFIGSGATDMFGIKADFDAETTYQKWRNKEQEWHYKAKDKNDRFKDVRDQVTADLNNLALKFPEKFTKIRNWFESGQDTHVLFEFSSPDEVTKEVLIKKYKLLALQCHPDKFQGDERKEAAIWFNLVMEARLDIEKNILEKR